MRRILVAAITLLAVLCAITGRAQEASSSSLEAMQLERQLNDGILTVNITAVADVRNPLQWVMDGNFISTLFQDEQGNTWRLNVQPRGTLITVTAVVTSLHPEVVRLNTVTTCFQSQLTASSATALADETGNTPNSLTNDLTAAKESENPTSRRLMSNDADEPIQLEENPRDEGGYLWGWINPPRGVEGGVSPIARHTLEAPAEFVDSNGDTIQTLGGDTTDSFAFRSRQNCKDAIREYYNGPHPSANLPASMEELDAFLTEHMDQKFRQLQLTAIDDSYGKYLFPDGKCRFSPRDLDKLDAGPKNTEGTPCIPECEDCTEADRLYMSRLNDDDWISGAWLGKISGKPQGLHYKDSKGDEQTSPTIFTTKLGSGDGRECYCSPMNDESYRNCPLNPWDEPSTGGRFQGCTKRPGIGFFCIPQVLEVQRRARSPVLTPSSTCSFWDRLAGSFTDWKCLAIMAGLSVVPFGSLAPAVPLANAAGLNLGCGCQDRHEVYNDDSVRWVEQRSLANGIANNQNTLTSMLADQQTEVAISAALFDKFSNVADLAMLQLEARNQQRLQIQNAMRLLTSNSTIESTRVAYLAVEAAGNYSRNAFATVDVTVGNMQAAVTVLQHQNAGAFAILQQGAQSAVDQLASTVDGSENAMRLTASTRDASNDITNALLNDFFGRDKYASTIPGELTALAKTLQDGWKPLTTDCDANTGQCGFYPAQTLPLDILRMQAAAHTFNAIVRPRWTGGPGRIVQGIWELDCRVDAFARSIDDILEPDDIQGMIGPGGCNMTSVLLHPSPGVCVCIPLYKRSECEYTTTKTLPQIARILSGTNAPLWDPSLAPLVCKSSKPVLVNRTKTYDTWDAFSADLVQSCKELSDTQSGATRLFNVTDVTGVTTSGRAIALETRTKHPTAIQAGVSDPGACSLSSDERKVGALQIGGQFGMIDALFNDWVNIFGTIRGTEQLFELRYALEGASVRSGVSRKFYKYSRTPQRQRKALDAISDQNMTSAQTLAAIDDATAQTIRDAKAQATLQNAGIAGSTLDDFKQQMAARMNLTAVDMASFDAPLSSLGPNTVVRGVDCVDSSFLASGPYSVPQFLVYTSGVAHPVAVSIEIENATDATLVANASVVSQVERILRQDITQRINSQAEFAGTDDGSVAILLSGIFYEVGLRSCFAGNNPCDLPLSSVGVTSQETNAMRGQRMFSVYDISNVDVATISATRLSQRIGKYGYSFKALGADGVYDRTTNASVYDRNVTHVPMFGIDDINAQHGIDPRMPQSNLLGYVPGDGAVSLERYRTQVLPVRTSFRSVDGALHTAVQFVCVKADADKGDTCRRIEALALLTDPELYGGETDPNRWTQYVYQPVKEQLLVSLELPASTVLAALQAARTTCALGLRVDRGRTDVQYVLRAIPPAKATGTVALRIETKSELGAIESAAKSLGCHLYSTVWYLNASTETPSTATPTGLAEFWLPSPCTLTEITVTNVASGEVCYSRTQSPVSSYDSSLPSEGELAISTMDIRQDRTTVLINTATLRVSTLVRTMTDAVEQRITNGIGEALQPGTTSAGRIGDGISNQTALDLAAITAILQQGIKDPLNSTDVTDDSAFSAAFAQFVRESNDTFADFAQQQAALNEYVVRRSRARLVAQDAQTRAQQAAAYLTELQHMQAALIGYNVLISQGATFDEITPEGWKLFRLIGEVELKNPGFCLKQVAAFLAHQKAYADAERDFEARQAVAQDPNAVVVASNPFSWGNVLHGNVGYRIASILLNLVIWGVPITAALLIFFLVPRCHPRRGICEDIAQSCRKHAHAPRGKATTSGRRHDPDDDDNTREGSTRRRDRGRRSSPAHGSGTDITQQMVSRTFASIDDIADSSDGGNDGPLYSSLDGGIDSDDGQSA